MSPRIAWQRSPFGALHGRVGGLRLFSINYGVVSDEGPYVLRSSLPGYDTRDRKTKTEEQAQAIAGNVSSPRS